VGVWAQPITCDVYVVVFSEYGGLVVCRVFTAVKCKPTCDDSPSELELELDESGI